MAEQTSVTHSAPWGPQGQHLQNIWSQAQLLAGTPQPYYPGSSVVPFAPQTEMGLGMIQNQAMAGTPFAGSAAQWANQAFTRPNIDLGGTFGSIGQAQSGLAPAMGQLGATASGAYLGRNPFLDAQFNQGASQLSDAYGRATAKTNLAFSGAGRTGSAAQMGALGQQQQALSQGLGQLGASIYGGAYENERNRQQAAAMGLQQGALNAGGLANSLFGSVSQAGAQAGALAPSLQQLQYADANQLLGVGNALQQQAGAYLQDDINHFNYYANQPWQQLQNYAQLVMGGNYGGSQTSHVNAPGNQIGQALGGAATGAALGSVIPGLGTGIGAAVGGGLGLLGGLFS